MIPMATRRIVLFGVVLLLVLTIATLELSGTNKAFSNAANEAKSKIHSSIKGNDIHEPGGDVTRGSSPEYCRWVFSHYEASSYELEWFSIIETAQDNICDTVWQPAHAEMSKKIVRRIMHLKSLDEAIRWRTYDSMLPGPAHPDDVLFSRMHYARECYDTSLHKFVSASGRGVQLIEPLWGMLRDPFDMWCADKRLSMPDWNGLSSQSKETIMPQGFAPYAYDEDATKPIQVAVQDNYLWRPQGIPPWHSSLIVERDSKLGTVMTKPRNIHLDLGSAYFGGWRGGGGASAASGHWFYDIYHKRGQPFDAFMAVELERLDPAEAYKQIPADLVGRYNLMNIGLSMGDEDKLNVINLIKRTVRPEDFFVFKLDIDSASIELPIIHNLLNDDPDSDGASRLIDELMFEHHVMYKPMAPGPWLPAGKENETLPESLADSYKVFRDLRIKSIRAHSWP